MLLNIMMPVFYSYFIHYESIYIHSVSWIMLHIFKIFLHNINMKQKLKAGDIMDDERSKSDTDEMKTRISVHYDEEGKAFDEIIKELIEWYFSKQS